MRKFEEVKGIKAFNPDFTCLGFKYEVGGEYEVDNLVMCKSGFHFCEKLKDTERFYDFNLSNHYCVVVGSGEVLKEGKKYCAKKLKVIRELSTTEVIEKHLGYIPKGDFTEAKNSIEKIYLALKASGN